MESGVRMEDQVWRGNVRPGGGVSEEDLLLGCGGQGGLGFCRRGDRGPRGPGALAGEQGTSACREGR